MKRALFVLSAVLGLAAFAAVPLIVGVEPTLRALGRVGWPGLAGFVANASLVLIAPGIGWWILMRGEGINVTPGQALRAVFMGYPIGIVTPSAQLGGEPLKTYYIARVTGAEKRQVLATIIVSKVQEVVGLVLVFIVAAALLVARAPLSPAQRTAVGAATGAMALAVLVVVVLFCRNARPTVRLINLAACFGFARRRLARLRGHARAMESMIHACFVRRWRRFLVAQAVTLLSALSNLFRPWVFSAFDAQGGLVGAEHLGGIYFVTNALNLIAFTPGGIGIFEGGVLGYFAASGLGNDLGAAYALVGRVSDITLLMIGAWFIVSAGLGKVAKGIAKGAEPPGE